MYPWYRESQIGVGQFCSPMTTIKTESGYNDCMLALDYAAQMPAQVVFSATGRLTKATHHQHFRIKDPIFSLYPELMASQLMGI
uniref:Uncharacterized protein n=1 Tax=Phlebotomus papatasi TaxID=29031 RepID=A0A1B0EXJ5_PHLPP